MTTTPTPTTQARLYERIEAHGEELLRLFPGATIKDPIRICKRLRSLESAAHSNAVRHCNGDISQADSDAFRSVLLERVRLLLGDVDGAVFVGGDPRGYALKIRDDWTRAHAPRMHQDWGGYGILAPDLREGLS